MTVYERDDAVGGLMRYGIPDFKLEKAHIDRRLSQLAAEGERFRTGVNVPGMICGGKARPLRRLARSCSVSGCSGLNV